MHLWLFTPFGVGTLIRYQQNPLESEKTNRLTFVLSYNEPKGSFANLVVFDLNYLFNIEPPKLRAMN
ncbi:MAG: hypothetical protein B6247_17650 [Candidatus Parabeggiatoa sp. nov. 2]|nr:MAG: hypothetical protein B6247_17650 [Beggiatoa sp. 4572_84]